MLNEECIRAIMIYLNKNLVPNSRRKIQGIYPRNIYSDFSDIFEKSEFNFTILYLLEAGFITKTNPEHKNCSANAIKINGITPKGYRYLEFVRDDTIWKGFRSKLTLENILNCISLGKTVSDFLRTLL